MNDLPDRIDRSIDINASAERVWGLISEPGWFINDNELTEHRIERSDDLSTVHDPVHGAFTFRTISLDRPRYAAYRWLADPNQPDSESTLVEFWIDEKSPSSVTLRVAESGFASLSGDAEQRRRQLEDNTEGWRIELGLAKAHLESQAEH